MIIAEIGLNHLGSVKIAEMYIQGIIGTQVDGVTFQIREKEYYTDSKKSHFELTNNDYIELSKYIQNHTLQFGVAIADIDKIDFLESINTDFYKVIRNDITNIQLTDKLIATGKKIIVSTGLSSDNDIKQFMDRYPNNSNIVLNHTQLSYDVNDCNLTAIPSMKQKYNCDISYGNHCDNIHTMYMSLCYNPSDILFYIKLDKTGKFPDDKHSVTLHDVLEVSANLKKLSNALGTGTKVKMNNKLEPKELTAEEKKNIDADSWDNTMWG